MEDMGQYGCTATNSGGSQRHEVYLEVTGLERFYFISKDILLELDASQVQIQNFGMRVQNQKFG